MRNAASVGHPQGRGRSGYLIDGPVMQRGGLLCAKCNRSRRARSCPRCGFDNVYIKIMYQSKLYRYWKNEHGKTLSYTEGLVLLATINQKIVEGTFDPKEYLAERIAERKFEHSFEQWIEQKEKEEKSNRLSPETLRCYKSYNRNYFECFNDMDVREVKLKHLQTFLDDLSPALSLNYKRRLMQCLHSFFSWLVRWGEIDKIPVFPLIHGDDAKPRRALTFEEQTEAILRIPDEHRGIYIFMRETAVRIGEACAVMVNDFDARNGRILIQRTWSCNKLLETTKGRKKSWIPLSDVAYAVVMKNVKDRIGNGFIFLNPATKKGYRDEFLRRIWKKYSGTDVTLYESMRHSTITDWVQFANAFDVKKLARHSDIRVTDRYVQAVDTRLRNAVNRKIIDFNASYK